MLLFKIKFGKVFPFTNVIHISTGIGPAKVNLLIHFDDKTMLSVTQITAPIFTFTKSLSLLSNFIVTV